MSALPRFAKSTPGSVPAAVVQGGRRYAQSHEAAYRAVKAGDWDSAARRLCALSTHSGFTAHDWLVLASARHKLGRIEEAQQAAERALALEPDNHKAAHIFTITLVHQNRWAEALAVFERFANGPARQQHDFVVNHAVTLQQLARHQDAVPVLLEAMLQQMADPAMHMRLGVTLKALKMYQESAESFLTAHTLDPKRFAAQVMVLHMRQYACQWKGYATSRAGIVEAMKALEQDDNPRGEGAVWALAAIEHPPVLFKKACGQVAAKHQRTARPLTPRAVSPAGQRLRIGYVSNDFHNHATALLMVEALEHRNQERCEVTLYSHSRDDGSALQKRVRSACERYVDMRAMSEQQMAQAIHADGIDILVDLKGHTFGNRLGVFAHRPAPIQVAWLGFPGTCGADYIDYIIGDPHVTPLAHAEHYSEHIAQMPHSYQPNDSQRQRPQAVTRGQCGLPEDAMVLGCFNQSFKIGPDNFAAWMRILQAVPNSLLWLLEDNEQATRNLRSEAQARGVDPARLVFAPRVATALHLSRLPLADLMLDNWPCNAHTTASDALWMGVPIVTLSGEIFASRVCASLLYAVGLGELACDNVAQYEATAIALLRDRERLQRLRNHLDSGRMGFPLFDGRRFAHDLDQLYLRMADRARAGLPPAALPAAGEAPQP